jgi:hypothetical protein
MHRERGIVATEAILSFFLLLVALLTLWSAVRLIYEKTSLDTASQISAQGGMTYFLRNAPISCNPDRTDLGLGFGDLSTEEERCQESFDDSRDLMWSLFEANVCDEDRAIGSEEGNGSFCSAEEEDFSINLQCKVVAGESLPESNPGAPDEGFSEDACSISNEDKKTARALIIRLTVEAEIKDVDWGLLDFAGGFSTQASAYGWRRLN